MIIKKNSFQKKIADNEAKVREEEEAKKLAEITLPDTDEISVKDIEQEVFDIDNIDFSQRDERRIGNRRRGYRRIDDRNLISRAQEEAIQIKESAYQEGYSLGLENAQKDLVAFKSILGAFMSSEKRVFDALAPELIEIAIKIAEKIIKHQVNVDPQIVIDTVTDILRTIPKNEPKITIKAAPTQAQYVKDNLPQVINLLGIESKINILSDESIQEGSCILQTNNGVVDASIESQIDIIQNALRSI